MALKATSLFLYGFEVTANNASIDFKSLSGGSVLMATVPVGFYTLGDLASAIVNAMQAVDFPNVYTVSIDRTVANGSQNRITISTSASFLSLLFGSGPRSASTIASLIGFTSTDQTGATSYTSTSSAGSVLITDFAGYNYLPVEMDHQVQGNVNISANGTKEAVVFQIQQFWTVEFKYEPEAKVKVQWLPLMDWLIQQRLFEFTPEITNPTLFYEGTLEKSAKDGKGLGYNFKEMLPDFPFLYQTGALNFRLRIT